jgi:2-polyprenyl-3-methyl-5-hydroxy-6-metoxy-1,4-benzoquinol methylase
VAWQAGAVPEYWNHNSAYHPWIVGIAKKHSGRVLDVGCGEGLLVERLAPVSSHVTGIDSDGGAIARARIRTTGIPNSTMIESGFEEFAARESTADGAGYDLVVFVAVLHHLPLADTLRRAKSLLRPGGELVVVGLSANRSAGDWIWSGLTLPVIRLMGMIHHETPDIGVITAQAHESLTEIRAVAKREIPGARIRRGLYYRYLLRWRTLPVS